MNKEEIEGKKNRKSVDFLKFLKFINDRKIREILSFAITMKKGDVKKKHLNTV